MSHAKYDSIRRRPPISLGAVLAIVAAIGGLVASCVDRARLGLALAVVSIFLGFTGVVGRTPAQGRPSMVSIFAIGLGIVGVLWAAVVLVFHIAPFPAR